MNARWILTWMATFIACLTFQSPEDYGLSYTCNVLNSRPNSKTVTGTKPLSSPPTAMVLLFFRANQPHTNDWGSWKGYKDGTTCLVPCTPSDSQTHIPSLCWGVGLWQAFPGGPSLLKEITNPKLTHSSRLNLSHPESSLCSSCKHLSVSTALQAGGNRHSASVKAWSEVLPRTSAASVVPRLWGFMPAIRVNKAVCLSHMWPWSFAVFRLLRVFFNHFKPTLKTWSWACWCIAVILALERLRQENLKF